MAEVIQAAVYVRVSTKDKDQDPRNQLLQIQAMASQNGWKIVRVYEDRESAGAGKQRDAYNRLFQDAASPGRKWDRLVFWSLDRFSREGVYETLHRLRELDRLGVRFLSLQEQYLATLGPFREAVIGILAAVAALERNRISERVKAGIARSKLEGKKFGRKPAELDEAKLLRDKDKGYSLAMLAASQGVCRTTVLRRLRQLDPRQP